MARDTAQTKDRDQRTGQTADRVVGATRREQANGTKLTDSPMMKHLIDAMNEGKDIGHYGRLVYVMVAQWFQSPDEMVQQLTKEQGVNETEARALVDEVKAHGYVPPRGNKIARWQKLQDFPICPDNNLAGCNVYDDLRFPDEVYNEIGEYWEERAEAEQQD